MNAIDFSFELRNRENPYTIIKNTMAQIEQITRGYVKGNVEEYTGRITSDTTTQGLSGLASALNFQTDIQEKLGKQDTKQNRFEVFLTAKGLEYYKYRMMFVDYGSISYPVKIVMDQDLAVEYIGQRKNVFYVESMDELQKMMDKVLSCGTMIYTIQSLIDEALRKENEKV